MYSIARGKKMKKKFYITYEDSLEDIIAAIFDHMNCDENLPQGPLDTKVFEMLIDIQEVKQKK